VRRIPGPTRRLVISPDAQDQLGGAVPSPAAAFLLTLILLPTLFWLVALKRTTEYLGVEGWLMGNVMQPLQAWMEEHLPVVDSALTAISALGSGSLRSVRARLRSSRTPTPTRGPHHGEYQGS